MAQTMVTVTNTHNGNKLQSLHIVIAGTVDAKRERVYVEQQVLSKADFAQQVQDFLCKVWDFASEGDLTVTIQLNENA
jgi:hypothetical protein